MDNLNKTYYFWRSNNQTDSVEEQQSDWQCGSAQALHLNDVCVCGQAPCSPVRSHSLWPQWLDLWGLVSNLNAPDSNEFGASEHSLFLVEAPSGFDPRVHGFETAMDQFGWLAPLEACFTGKVTLQDDWPYDTAKEILLSPIVLLGLSLAREFILPCGQDQSRAKKHFCSPNERLPNSVF